MIDYGVFVAAPGQNLIFDLLSMRLVDRLEWLIFWVNDREHLILVARLHKCSYAFLHNFNVLDRVTLPVQILTHLEELRAELLAHDRQ